MAGRRGQTPSGRVPACLSPCPHWGGDRSRAAAQTTLPPWAATPAAGVQGRPAPLQPRAPASCPAEWQPTSCWPRAAARPVTAATAPPCDPTGLRQPWHLHPWALSDQPPVDVPVSTQLPQLWLSSRTRGSPHPAPHTTQRLHKWAQEGARASISHPHTAALMRTRTLNHAQHRGPHASACAGPTVWKHRGGDQAYPRFR